MKKNTPKPDGTLPHRVSRPLVEINTSLNSLRDFVDAVDLYLKAQGYSVFVSNQNALKPLILGLHKLREADGKNLINIQADQLSDLQAEYPQAAASEVVRDDAGGLTVNIPLKGRAEKALLPAIREINRNASHKQLLYSSALMNLTSSVELFFANLLHEFFMLHPNAIGTREKVFSFDDLSAFSTIDDARNHYVLSKIEILLRGPLREWIDFAKTTLKLSLGYITDIQPALEETFQRRNVIVHNGGIANSIYLSKVEPSARVSINVGTNLTPNRSYLNERIDTWERACILIASELWKKLVPADSKRGEFLLTMATEHLSATRWAIAESMSTFLIADKALSEGTHLTAQLYLWHCKKATGKWDSIKKEVRTADYTAKNVRFQLALLSFTEEWDKFAELAPKAIQNGELTLADLNSSPLFSAFRSDPKNKTIFLKLKRLVGRTSKERKHARRLD